MLLYPLWDHVESTQELNLPSVERLEKLLTDTQVLELEAIPEPVNFLCGYRSLYEPNNVPSSGKNGALKTMCLALPLVVL